MRRKTLRSASRVPGLYALLALIFAARVTVKGQSMAPALLPGERFLVDRLAYRRSDPRVGEVLLIEHPKCPGLKLVKRLTAVELGDGAARYRVEGDNLAVSTDSREFGTVRRSGILGRAWIRYWPVERWEVFGS
jgi:nickel-type superoxide dismutase maturation protease